MAQRTYQINPKQLDALRAKRGWTFADLAIKAIVSDRTLTSLMAGQPALLSTLQKVAGALEVPIELLLVNDKPEPEPVIDDGPTRIQVKVTLSMSAKLFDEIFHTEQFKLLLQKLLGGRGDIQVNRVDPGSTVLTMEMTPTQALALIEMYLAGNRDLSPDFTVTDLQFGQRHGFMLGMLLEKTEGRLQALTRRLYAGARFVTFGIFCAFCSVAYLVFDYRRHHPDSGGIQVDFGEFSGPIVLGFLVMVLTLTIYIVIDSWRLRKAIQRSFKACTEFSNMTPR
jgi:transcriptional regulator with XRE-family HTH domain